MSIYQRGFDFQFAWGKGKPFFILLIIALAVLLTGLGYVVLQLWDQPVLVVSLDDATLKSHEQTFLQIDITNRTPIEHNNILIKVAAADRGSFDVSPSEITISVLEKEGGSRNIEVFINPIQNVLPGKYTINVDAVMGEEIYSKSVILEIIK